MENTRVKPKPTLHDRQYLSGDYARYLYAMTVGGRQAWGRALCDELESYFMLGADAPHPDEDVFFFTLGDARCVTDDDDAGAINLGHFKAILGYALRGRSFVGIMEPAYYVNVAAVPGITRRRLISWHVHGFVWDIEKEELRRLLKAARKAGYYRPVYPGQRPTDFIEVPRGRIGGPGTRTHLAEKLRYMSKVAVKAYRLYKTERVTKDGELVPAFRQKKSALKPAEAVRLFRMLKHLHLDHLAFGDGAGKRILTRAKRVALRRMPEAKSKASRRKRSALSKPAFGLPTEATRR